MTVITAKMADVNEMPFGMESGMGMGNCALDRGPDIKERAILFGDRHEAAGCNE